MSYRLLSTVRRAVTPYKSLSVYEQYFDTFNRIHLFGDGQVKKCLLKQMILFLYFALLHLFLYLLPPSTPEPFRILLVDFVWALGLHSNFNLITVFQSLLVIYFIQIMYLNDSGTSLNDLMSQILFPQLRSLPSASKFHPSSYQKVRTRKVQLLAWLSINSLQMFTLLLDVCATLIIGICLSLYFTDTFTNWTCSWWTFIFSFITFLLHLFHLALFSVTFLLYAYLISFIAAYGITTVGYFFLRMAIFHADIANLLSQKVGTIFTCKTIAPIEGDLVDLLRILFACDGLFRKIFFSFLLVNLPTSALIVMMFLHHENIHGVALWGVLGIISQEFVGTLGIHLVMARLSKKLHQTGPRLLKVKARNQHRVGNSRAHLRLEFFIARIHTRRPYGLTYGGLALITMATFTKCMLLYGRFFMFAYKFVRY